MTAWKGRIVSKEFEAWPGESRLGDSVIWRYPSKDPRWIAEDERFRARLRSGLRDSAEDDQRCAPMIGSSPRDPLDGCVWIEKS